jgi:cytochrome P450
VNAREAARNIVQNVAVPVLTGIERVQYGVAFNPLKREFRRDPYPAYRALQAKDPFHRSRLVGGWVLTRYDDVSAVLRDNRFLADDRKLPFFAKNRKRLRDAGVLTEEEAGRDAPTMLRSDPPDHTRLRSLVNRAFTPRAIESLQPRIEQIVAELLDPIAGEGAMDAIRDLAYPLPVIVIAEMLGIPPEDREQFKKWSDDVVGDVGLASIDDSRRAMEAFRALCAYLEPILQERRREPREDLLSALLAAEEAGDRLTMEEMYTMVTLLLVAGNETTTNLIGNGLLALLRHPEQLALLRDEPALIGDAIEELLRYDSPVQATTRFVVEDVDLAGHRIRAGHQMALLLGAANRDPSRFARPDEVDITRTNVQPLSFGSGIHYCLGAPLARVEGRIALGALLERFPNVRLATDDLEWNDNVILRGLKALPLAV